MAGHSKWANIKRRKGAQDAIRGKLFTKLIREITVAAQLGGGELEANARLRLAVDKARSNSMPKDNIARAIAKGCGELDMANYEELTMEGYGTGGVAVLLEILTDNRNRTASEVRHAFTSYSGNLGTNGCVGYMFHRKGVILVGGEDVDEDQLMLTALDLGAEDVSEEDEGWEILTAPDTFETIRNGLQQIGLAVESAELTFVPDNTQVIEGDQAELFIRMVETLEECDDVQGVHHNADISAEEFARIVG
jgi:YebC/PmpR family DNA-binding regulatory protein